MEPKIPVLKSKIKSPFLQTNQVTRTRLLQELNHGLWRVGVNEFNRRITLISAPAGYGKSTLLGDWIRDIENSAWLSLDEVDDDPARFWFYIITALREIEKEIGQAALSVLGTSPLTLEESRKREFLYEEPLIYLLNELSKLENPLLLVLDDYHLISDEHIHKGITFLVENSPSTFHLVISSRSDPPVALARWRSKGWMNEVRQKELRFTIGEALDYFGREGKLSLSQKNVELLIERTEGWAGALQIAAISMAGIEEKEQEDFLRAFTRSKRYLWEFLTDEVINRQPQYLRDFLLKTSILSYLSPSLCREITGHTDSAEILNNLRKHNLFIFPMDEEGHWYRYHALFKEFLQHRLYNTQNEEVAGLHEKACFWYEAHGYASQAIDQAIKAGAYSKAAKLLNSFAEELFSRAEQKSLQTWLRKIPRKYIGDYPRLIIIESMMLYLSGKIGEAKAVLAEVAYILEAVKENKKGNFLSGDDEDPTELKGMYLAMQSFIHLFSGDYQLMMEKARLAQDYLAEEKSLWYSGVLVISGDVNSLSGALQAAAEAYKKAVVTCRRSGDNFFTLLAGFKLTRVLFYQGMFKEVENICVELTNEASNNGFAKTARTGALIVLTGMIQCERNLLDEALVCVKKGLSLIESENYMLSGWAYACLARLFMARGELDAAAEALRKTENYGVTGEILYLDNLAAAGKARLLSISGRDDMYLLEEAYHLLKRRLLCREESSINNNWEAAGPIQFFRLDEYLEFVRVLIARSCGDQAEPILQQLEQIARKERAVYLFVEIFLLQALARISVKDSAQDADREQKALEIIRQGIGLTGQQARKEGFVRIFLDQGPALARLLYKAVEAGIYPDYLGEILSAFPVETAGEIMGDTEKTMIEPLSKRELEVLQLIADGLSNKEIGDKLFLSLNTVKWHIKNIYAKLGVDTRTGSVARARSLKLVK